MSGELFTSDLDPLGFVVDELSARGALVERGDHGALAVLPPPLARSLDLPDTLTLTDVGSDHTIGCGLGSPMLDRLASAARATGVIFAGCAPRIGAGWRTDRMSIITLK